MAEREDSIVRKKKAPDPTVLTIDTAAYLSVLRELVENGKSVSLIVAGNSMFPFLEHERDTVYFEAPKRKLRKGDIVFYQRRNGQFVMHRIYKAEGDSYFIVGDAQRVIEGPVLGDQIFAIVTQVKRNGKVLTPSSLKWKFFEKVWINLVPYRGVLMLPYRVVRKVRTMIGDGS